MCLKNRHIIIEWCFIVGVRVTGNFLFNIPNMRAKSALCLSYLHFCDEEWGDNLQRGCSTTGSSRDNRCAFGLSCCSEVSRLWHPLLATATASWGSCQPSHHVENQWRIQAPAKVLSLPQTSVIPISYC